MDRDTVSQQITNDFKCPKCGGNHWKITDHSNLELIVCRSCKWQGTREEGFTVEETVAVKHIDDITKLSLVCGLQDLKPLLTGEAGYLGIYKDPCERLCSIMGWEFIKT